MPKWRRNMLHTVKKIERWDCEQRTEGSVHHIYQAPLPLYWQLKLNNVMSFSCDVDAHIQDLQHNLKKKNSSCWVTAYFISSFSICEGSYQRKQMTKDIRWLLCWSLSTQNLLFYSCENLFNFKTDQCLFICQNECNCSFPYCKLHKADRKIHC